MKVKDIYQAQVKACTPVTSLDAVGRIMWEGDSGAVPVVNPEGKVTGIITDRDLAMAMAAKNRGSAQILVREITSGDLFSCALEDELGVAIERMRTHRVRRLPVLDSQGQLLGMLSLKDLALAANGTSGLTYEDVALTLQALCKPRTESVPQWPWVNAASR